MKIQAILSKNLKSERKKKDLTQEELAEKAGLSPDAIQMIERKKRWPTLATLEAISKALKVHAVDLFKR